MLTGRTPPAETDEQTSEFGTPTVTVAHGGRCVTLHIPGIPGARAGVPKRGIIREFSRRSRNRLMRLMLGVDQTRVDHFPLLITLTYPAEWPATTAQCKRHLDTFVKRLRRRYPRAALVWKMEYQERGAPHFHLLVWNVRFIPYAQVAQDWYEVVGTGDKAHLAAGTEVRRARSWRGVAYYVSKYLCKATEAGGDENPGRFWGIIGREYLPYSVLVRVISWTTAYKLRRALWRYAARHGYSTRRKGSYLGVTVFMTSLDATRLLNST